MVGGASRACSEHAVRNESVGNVGGSPGVASRTKAKRASAMAPAGEMRRDEQNRRRERQKGRRATWE